MDGTPANARPLLTLTTDFGAGSPYVAALKGVLLAGNPSLSLHDLSHDIAPQDLAHAAFFLRECLPYFDPATVHLVVVDPGVGTARKALVVELPCGRLVGPDNGFWTWLPGAEQAVVHEISRKDWLPSSIAPTFHGRDVFAPVAARLSWGEPTAAVGPRLDSWVTLPCPMPERTAAGWRGAVQFIDTFGNLITNLSWGALGSIEAVQIGGERIERRVTTYGEAPAGTLIFLRSSGGWLEVAQVNGHAAQALSAKRGHPVSITASR